MASQYFSRLGIVMGIDTAELSADVEKAIGETKRMKRGIEAEAKAIEKEMLALKFATDNYGKSVTKVAQLQQEFAMGKYSKIPDSARQALLAQAAAYDKVAASAQKANMARVGMLGGTAGQGKLNQQQIAALSYQTTDIVTGLAGGQNPLLVLIQQGGQLRDQFGGIVPLFKAIGSLFTATRVIVGGLAAAIGTLALAAYKGEQEFKELRSSLALTNNIAGLTFDSINKLSYALADRLNISLGSSKEIFAELIKSGRFTASSMESVATVIGTIAKISGESAQVVAQELIPSFNGSASSAKSLNERFNFLTEAQYRQIDALEMAGQKQRAAEMTADLLNQSLVRQQKELGITEGWWKRATRAMSDFWEKLKEFGAPETDQERLISLARSAEAIEKSVLVSGPQGEAIKKQMQEEANQAYLNQYKMMLEKRNKLEQDADKQQRENKGIDDFAAAGGERKRQEIISGTQKVYADMRFRQAVADQEEFDRIRLEGEKKKEEAALEFARQNQLTKFKFQQELLDQYNAKVVAAEAEVQERILEVSRRAAEEVRKEQQGRYDALMTEKEKLDIYEKNILISEADYKITMNRLKAEQEIAKIRANKELTDEAKDLAIGRERDIENRANEIAKLEERLNHLREVNSAVFSSMNSAIDQFVRNGKLSFSDFAKSLIQDILAIYLKAQLLQMFSMGSSLLGSVSTAFRYGTNVGSQQTAMLAAQGFADGGNPPVGVPSIVGERGPELFVPRTAGTIIPNHQLSSAMQQPQVIYNGPYIANMQAIDTQSATQFLARNKEAVWSANQSASRSIPTSR